MDQEKLMENLVVTCLDTAKAMLDEYKMVIPFGIRAFKESDDLKMNCPGDKKPEANFDKQIEMVVGELKTFVQNEPIYATALVTELESGDEKAIGMQIETEQSPVLFVYPFHKESEQWIIDEPIQTDQLLATVF
ncbi:MAG: hypothetical protein QNL62_18825 [Gammaproteobacteria bacterium]|nr:hypothetical protein [Gammaproteobacteria bacterium]